MKPLPIGIENFKELIDRQYYFADKSDLINDLAKEKIVIYTRPRRFGKTLMLSMLYYFFSVCERDNAYLFEHLKITVTIHSREMKGHGKNTMLESVF